MTIKMTHGEVEALAKHPEVLLALASLHDVWESEADSVGFDGSEQHHSERRKELRAAALQIVQADPDCWPDHVLQELGLPVRHAARVSEPVATFDPAVPTNDRLRAIARQAESRSGPSDPTSGVEYVLEGWREAEKHHGIKP